MGLIDMPSSPTPEKPACIEILLVDDRPSLRRVVRVLIEREPRFKVVAEAASPAEALAAASQAKPRLAIVDLALGQAGSGLDLIADLKKQQPDLLILVLSMHSADLHAKHALRAGALGYVMKDQAPDHLHAAMDAVLNGKIWLPE